MAKRSTAISLENLQSKSVAQLRKLSKLMHVASSGLQKQQIIENLMAKKQGETPPHRTTIRNRKLREYLDNAPHEITPQIRHYCFLFAADYSGKTRAQWAKIFKVTPETIYRWSEFPECKELIAKFTADKEARINHILEQHEEEVIRSLLEMTRSKKMNDTKRKAIVDFLAYAGRRHPNVAKFIQIQGQSVKGGSEAIADDLSNMSDDELRQELDDLTRQLE